MHCLKEMQRQQDPNPRCLELVISARDLQEAMTYMDRTYQFTQRGVDDVCLYGKLVKRVYTLECCSRLSFACSSFSFA